MELNKDTITGFCKEHKKEIIGGLALVGIGAACGWGMRVLSNTIWNSRHIPAYRVTNDLELAKEFLNCADVVEACEKMGDKAEILVILLDR